MEISGITNLNQYLIASTKQLNIKFNQSKIDVSGQKATENSFLSEFIKQNAENQKTKRIEGIKGKLKMGQKLSHADMEYLRNNDPALYEKAVKIKKERENYRRDLNNCKTKKEALMVNFRKLAQFKMEEKREDPETLIMRMAAILNEHTDFVKSREYKDLPRDEIEEAEESDYNHKSDESDESKNKTKFKNKKAKKINLPEIRVELPNAYRVKQESPNVFASLRA